ncbi:hypothetical protein JOF29_007403 [Kribbella aluminosa]|uniref:Uncharacterized protein n=1 Tax=Kribbella aluminosa TaxID=416017 RepID=A0ABS4UXA5_9ACTN|nr:hypothetical protein [Kribbella aluminosa]MBP2356293.1 hypothetical protein [Kribbella aluminosa]
MVDDLLENHLAFAEAFAEVQSAAFLEEGEPDCDWWRQMFGERAVQNYAAPDQYLLRVDGDPASITLVLRTDSGRRRLRGRHETAVPRPRTRHQLARPGAT